MRTLSVLILASALTWTLSACAEKEEGEGAPVADSTAPVDTSHESGGTSTAYISEADQWLEGRYGPGSGTVVLEVQASGQTTRQVRYFEDHGAKDALRWYLGNDERGPIYYTIVQDGKVTMYGPGDSTATRMDWKPNPNTAMPNFQRLTSEMREMFEIKELPEKKVLDRTCTGYRMKVGRMISDVWVWEGIMLHGEIQGSADGSVEPIVIDAVSIDTASAVPPDAFSLPQGVMVKG